MVGETKVSNRDGKNTGQRNVSGDVALAAASIGLMAGTAVLLGNTIPPKTSERASAMLDAVTSPFKPHQLDTAREKATVQARKRYVEKLDAELEKASHRKSQAR